MKSKRLLLALALALLVPWAANAQNSIPYNEGFESMSSASDLTTAGWISYQSHSGSFLAIDETSYNVHTGTKALKIDSWDAGSNSDYVILGLPTVDAAIKTLQITFSYRISSASGGNMEVGYLTNVDDASTFVSLQTCANSTSYATKTVELNGTPNDAARIAIKYIGYYRCYVDDIEVKTLPTCLKPTGLNFALTPGDGTVAKLSWTSDADAWQICLNGDETNLIPATTNPYTLTGLTPETTYTAKVRANCGSEQSDWSNEVTFTPTDAYTLTVNDGTTTNGLVPIYGAWVDNITKSQFIIPAENLTDMAWGTINKMTFYAAEDKNWGAAQFEVYMTETSETTLSALADYGTMTKVKNAGSLSISGNQMVVELDAPYQYIGGNLMIGFLQTVTGTWSGCSWYGVSAEGASMGGYGSYISQQNFLPKTTFDYEPGEEPACMWPTNLAVSNVTAHTAELSWTSDGTAWNIGYTAAGGTEQYVEGVTENPYTLTGLDPETEYSVRVQKYCSDGGFSIFSDFVSFTTGIACHAPKDLVISDITAYSANVSWTGEAANYEMEYAVAGTGGSVTYDFEDGTLQGWTNLIVNAEGGQWLHSNEQPYGHDYTALAHSGTGFALCYSFIDYTGSFDTDAYLVSPTSYSIADNASLNFWYDMANDAYPEDFEVCVATVANPTASDFTPIWTLPTDRANNGLREATEVRQRNTRSNNWREVSLDLNAYAGQSIWIAFHDVNYDMYEVWIDDITVNAGGELTWIPVGTVTSPYTLSNLEAETTYLVRLRANCGDEGYSAWLQGSITTLPLCMVPTNLVISNIDKRSADLAWTSNGEETAWQISLNDGTNERIIDATATTYSFTGLTPETRYTVKVRAVCDATLQSAWSSPAVFTTSVACPAPTGLAISDITNVSAVATWTYDGDVELEYAEDVWKYYDNGIAYGSLGYYGTLSWAIMLTPDMLPANQPLTHVAVYENQNNTLPITVSIYSGGNDAPGTLLYTEDVTPVGNGFHEFALNEAVTFDATQNLWIVCFSEDQYPVVASTNTGTTNGGWVSLDSGTTWNNSSSSYTWMIRAAFGNNTQTEWVAVNNPASPQTIAGLTPETNYFVRLRAVCGGDDGESVWVNTSFTTDIACPAPTALAATPYALSAELSWEGTSESYTVRYRTAAYTEGVSEEFLSSSIPSGWTMYTGLLSAIMEGTATLSSTTYAWAFGTANGVFDSHAFCNIYNNYQRWLVTPAMEVPAGAVFSFDMALTVYTSGSSASPTPGNQADDKFVVLVSTDEMATWTILRQWDNAGSEYVYDNITNNANGEHVSFDFSAYAGQTVYIAFYGESTVSGGDNNLHIDNVAIGTAMPAGEWMTVDADEATATITGLMPETTYEWKVQGNCGEWGMSEESAIMTFTTTNDLCPVPTNLTVNNETITATTADLSWEGSPDVESFTVRYRTPEHYVGGIYADFESGTMPEGWTQSGPGTWFVNAGYGYNGIAAHGGTYNLRIGHSDRENETFLITPMMDLSGQTDPTLSFWYINYNWGASDIDQIFVYYRVDEGEWVDLWNTTEDHQEWTESGEIVLPNPSANYQVGFKMVDKYGRGVGLDDIIIGNPTLVPATDWQLVENITDMNVTLTGLTPETPYEAQVKADCSDPEAWSNTVNFTTPVYAQTIALNEGTTFVSFNVEVTLNELKAALLEAVPGTAILISGQNNTTNYDPARNRWLGNLSWDVAKMYKINVTSACEITLEGMPIDPADHPVTINNGNNYIAFPLNQNMTLTNAFAGFAVNGDKISSQTGTSVYTRGRWQGNISELQPGKGYIYNSVASESKTFVFPANSK